MNRFTLNSGCPQIRSCNAVRIQSRKLPIPRGISLEGRVLGRSLAEFQDELGTAGKQLVDRAEYIRVLGWGWVGGVGASGCIENELLQRIENELTSN